MADYMYRQIAEDLRGQIKAGDLAPGAQLPTELELRERYKDPTGQPASRNTVRDAVKLLAVEGLVATRAGRGTYVVEKVEPFVTRRSGAPEGGETADYRGQDRKVKDTTPRVEIHLGSAAPELGRDQTAETVISRHQDRQIDGQPYSMETSFYPKEYADEAADLGKVGDIKEGTVVYLRNALGIKQAGYRDKIIVRPPDPQEATFFRLPAAGQIQMLETRRVAFDEGGEPIRVTVTVYPADRNQLVYEVGAVPPEPSASASNPAADEASLERSG